MAQQTLNNGDSGTTFRGKCNSNFDELYARSNWNTSGATSVTTPTITGNVTFTGNQTFNGNLTQNKTETAVDDSRPVIWTHTYNVQPASLPAMGIDYHGVDILMSSSGNTNSDTRLYPFEVRGIHSGVNTLNRIVTTYIAGRNVSSGTVSDITLQRCLVSNLGTGTIGTARARSVENPINSGGGTITTWYSDYLENPTTAGTNWGYYSLAANNYQSGLALGDTPSGVLATSVMVDMKSTTKAPVLPRMTTTQRDALTAVSGMLIYNTTTGKLNVRGASAWEAVTSA